MKKWLGRTIRRLVNAVRAPAAPSAIIDTYVTSPPSPENAARIFEDEWVSAFPSPFETVTGGKALLFDDHRVHWALERLGSVAGHRVLELGPLEGGHTYMLDRAGAGEVFAIEANTRAFLKCLVAKEIVGMPSARFVCGDFRAFLRDTSERFDLVIASGVLYHMVNPVEVLSQICRVTNRVFLWTHYYDEALLAANPETKHRVMPGQPSEHAGYRHELYRHDYGRALEEHGFCGAGALYSNWLTRDAIVGALRHFGFEQSKLARSSHSMSADPRSASRRPGARRRKTSSASDHEPLLELIAPS
ncbi:MAG: class I SAM-dependent methyltransferase [Acidobacteria bacterium]|nr:class I SAM-dependent methyltransferase [Acidobacteriota bacterium]